MSVIAAIPVLTPTWTFCLILAFLSVAATIVGTVYLTKLYKTGKAAGTWTSFLIGPGAIQAASLHVGMLLAALGATCGPLGETGPSEAAVYRWQVNAAQQPQFTTGYIDASRYAYVTVAARVVNPARNAGAMVVVYGLDETGRAGAVRRVAATGAWSVWHSRNGSKQLRIGVDKPAMGTAVATHVEIELILAAAPPQEFSDSAAATAPATTTR